MNSGRSSRSNSKANVGEDLAYRSSERREKVRSTTTSRRGSLKPIETEVISHSYANRPPLPRTRSAPLIELPADPVDVSLLSRPYVGEEHDQRYTERRDDTEQATGGALEDGQDEDEAAGVVGSPRHFPQFQSSKHEERLPEINIAIIGADDVGKTTFVQRALSLPYPPRSPAVERRLTFQNNHYIVRFLEIPIEDIDTDEDDDSICWPETIDNKMTPRIDGALTLYDVTEKSSLHQVPEILTALSKASIPSILISSKCDVAPVERDLDPVAIEEKAKRSVRNLATLQTSNATPDNNKRGIAMILRAVASAASGERQTSNRRRAKSNAVRPVSPQPPNTKGHARASSELSSGLYRDKLHARHDSSLASYGSSDRLKMPHEPVEDGMQRSFLFEESGNESSTDNSDVSPSAEVSISAFTTPLAVSTLCENGATFDELVDRLLAHPMSKADSKFSAIFLALYRKFAAPGRLLEAIVDRFDALGRGSGPEMMKNVAQLRCLSTIEQWMSYYPGDFAFPKTKHRMQTFIAKMAVEPMFSAAAAEMSADLDVVQEDDDTNWAYNDKDRVLYETQTERWTISSTASTLIDDVSFSLQESLSGLTATDDVSIAATMAADAGRSATESMTPSQILYNVDAAQRQAQLLEPRPRVPLSKVEWRSLMEIPEDLIAKELTRMDCVMFSSIRPRDLVRHVSLSSDEKAACKSLVNVNRMIDHFNHLAAWVSNFILLRDKPKHRALMLEKLMRVARKLRELNNYNALGAVIAGINSSPVLRLAATRDLIPPSVGKDWLKLEILMSPSRSYGPYRLAWENSSSERIPYIPLHRRDLVSAEEGNKTFIGNEEDGRVNWKKIHIIGEFIVSLQHAQGLPYHGLVTWKGGEQVRDLLLEVKITSDEEELYARSTQCEPPAGAGATTSTRFKEFFKR